MTEHARTLLLLGVITLGVAQIRAQRRILRAVDTQRAPVIDLDDRRRERATRHAG